MKTSTPYTTEAVSRSETAPSTSRQLSAPRLICRCQQQARPPSGTPSASACNWQVRSLTLVTTSRIMALPQARDDRMRTYPNHPEFLTRMQHFGLPVRAQWQRQLAICKSWTSSPPNRRYQACEEAAFASARIPACLCSTDCGDKHAVPNPWTHSSNTSTGPNRPLRRAIVVRWNRRDGSAVSDPGSPFRPFSVSVTNKSSSLPRSLSGQTMGEILLAPPSFGRRW